MTDFHKTEGGCRRGDRQRKPKFRVCRRTARKTGGSPWSPNGTGTRGHSGSGTGQEGLNGRAEASCAGEKDVAGGSWWGSRLRKNGRDAQLGSVVAKMTRMHAQDKDLERQIFFRCLTDL